MVGWEKWERTLKQVHPFIRTMNETFQIDKNVVHVQVWNRHYSGLLYNTHLASFSLVSVRSKKLLLRLSSAELWGKMWFRQLGLQAQKYSERHWWKEIKHEQSFSVLYLWEPLELEYLTINKHVVCKVLRQCKSGKVSNDPGLCIRALSHRFYNTCKLNFIYLHWLPTAHERPTDVYLQISIEKWLYIILWDRSLFRLLVSICVPISA